MILTAFKMPLGEAALVAVLGLLIVFAVLAVLVGILTIFKLIFTRVEQGKTVSPPSQSSTADAEASEDDTEIVAAITAAIACMSESESARAPFRIKSIRRLK